ncbi:nucleoside phosphorylase [Guggenheimella bovis]
MWLLDNDNTEALITAKEHIDSSHGGKRVKLPGTVVVFFMGGWMDYLRDYEKGYELEEPFPRFLHSCPIWMLKGNDDIAFLDGGRGAPMAADTVETLAELGVKTILGVGMIGGYSSKVEVGEIISPSKAFSEEGTSIHYYGIKDFYEPDDTLLDFIKCELHVNDYPIVTTDAVYRQTYAKEELWRKKGCVGVDMETSALFSVSKYVGIRAASILMVSDVHPETPQDRKWEWLITKDMRYTMFSKAINLAKKIKDFI